MSTEAKKLTYEAWLALPETKERYEIVDGVLKMPPDPTPAHQWYQMELAVRIRAFVDEARLGMVLAAPVDLLIRRNPLRMRQPDILYLSAERSGIEGVAQLQGLQYLETAPDLVVEVLSPSNIRREIEQKLDDYRSVGVLECWLVSPEAKTVEVLRLPAEEATTGSIFGVGDTLRSQVLSDFSLVLRDIFG